MDCDICINNLLAIRNTLLLRVYASCDPRVRQLVYIVKHWAKQRKINSPSEYTLSSYGYILLLINYLQRIRLLPVLQRLPPQWPHDTDNSVLPTRYIVGRDGESHDTYFYADPEGTFKGWAFVGISCWCLYTGLVFMSSSIPECFAFY